MERLLPFVNIADHTLHCTQINSFELGNSIRKRFDGNVNHVFGAKNVRSDLHPCQ